MSKQSNHADIVLINGFIYTVNAEDTIAEALAIKDGLIEAVGSDDRIKPLVGPATRVFDLEGKMVLPGMIDSHLHPPAAKMMQSSVIYLSNIDSREKVLQTVEEFIKQNPGFQAYFGWGWTINLFEGEERNLGPKKETLDQICFDCPITLQSNDGHSIWANSKALELAGLTASTPDPKGGIIVKNPTNGELWGTLTGTARNLLTTQTFTTEQLLQAVKSFQKFMHSLGYTAFFSAGSKPEKLQEIFRALEKNGELKIWVRDSKRISIDVHETPEEQIQELFNLSGEYNTELYQINAAKIFIDGVVEAGTARLLDPYEESLGMGPDHYGIYYWDDMEALVKTIVDANRLGIQVHIHSIGDRATRDALDAFEQALIKAPGEHRNIITHLQLVHPDDLKRFKKLGVIANVQPYWHVKKPGWWYEVEYANIGKRAENEYPLRSLANAGALITTSSDYPVVETPDPLWAIKTGITRSFYNSEHNNLDAINYIDDETCLLNKNERVSLKEMIRSLTFNNAYALFIDNKTGSIESGKYADLVVLSENLFELSPFEIDKAKVCKTFFHGEIVYEA